MELVEHTLHQGGQSITLKLFENDHITKTVVSSNDFYERTMLNDIMRRTDPGDLAVDVGAYVGTHTVFMAAVAGLKVIAIEPFEESRSVLQDNVLRNEISDQVEIHGFAAGARREAGDFVTRDVANLGMMAVTPGEGGVEINPLDDYIADSPVRVLKIDVEGMEVDVLEGAVETLKRARPFVYVETADPTHERAIWRLMEEYDYRFAREFNQTPTHLFVPSENIAPAIYPTWLADQAADHAYALRDATRSMETILGSLQTQSLELRAYREQLRRTTEMFSELYKRTRSATVLNTEILERLKLIEQKLNEGDEAAIEKSDEASPE